MESKSSQNNATAAAVRVPGDKRSLTRLGSVSSMVTELEIEMLEKKLDSLREKVKRRGRVISFVFGIKENLSYVRTVIDAFESQSIKVMHIETRKSRVPEINYDILIDVEANDSVAIQNALAKLDEKICGVEMNEFGLSPPSTPKRHLNGITEPATWTTATYETNGSHNNNNNGSANTSTHNNLESELDGYPWFPRKLEDMDIIANRVLMYGPSLDADHPGFKDESYRKRRMQIADVAYNYKSGEIIPRVEYSPEEVVAWGMVYKALTSLYPTHACKEFLDGFAALQKYCGYSEHKVPQLCDVSAFLRERTGFSLRPVAGYLSPRDFLSGLAFRVFHCTQYIRHASQPLYTPEPDCCHELMGHMAMLLDPAFAQFSQEIGLASLGASDDEVKKLATCYFFTIEFGLCIEDGKYKAYGAGLLSSASELQHAVSSNAAEVLPFDPKVVAEQECLITTFQNRYFYTRTFEDAKEKMREFAKTIQRPFTVRFNPYTQAMEVLDTARSIEAVVSEMKGDVALISNALQLICSKRK